MAKFLVNKITLNLPLNRAYSSWGEVIVDNAELLVILTTEYLLKIYKSESKTKVEVLLTKTIKNLWLLSMIHSLKL